MKFKGILIGAASGSVGSNTFSHNRGGQYIRQRAVPTDPGSTQQQVIRSAMANLTSRWRNILTEAERALWDTYALNVPIPDSLGDPRNIGGLGQYIRSNVPAIQVGLDIQDTAPEIFNLGEYTAPTFISATAPTALSIGFENSDAWANEDGSAMLIYSSRPVNTSVNFFKGPYRFAGMIEGDDTTAPTSPAAITAAFPFAAGQKVYIQGRIIRTDGRLSSPFRLFSIGV